MKILVIGAGYSGMEIIKQAQSQGIACIGTTRSPEKLEKIQAMGALGVQWDIQHDNIEKLMPYLTPETVVVFSLPTLFETYEPAHDDSLARHLAPVERVLNSCGQNNIRHFIYLSSTSVLGDHNGEWVDENTPCKPDSPYGKMRKEIEDHCISYAGHFDVCIARLVGIYGPGRTLEKALKSGQYTLVDGGKKVTNRIHVEDIAQAVLAMAERAPEGAQIYHVCDGNPLSVRELVEFVCAKLGIALPPEESLEEYAARKQNPNVVGRWKSTYRCKNTRLIDELGVELRFPDAIKGYEALLKGCL